MTRRATASLVAVLATLAGATSAHAVTYPAGFEEQTLISGLAQPTAVAWAPNGRAFIVEKRGVLKTAAPGSSTATTVLDLRTQVNSHVDRGMLGVAVDSQFASNGYVYVLYTYDRLPATPDSSQPMVSQLLRLKLGPDNLPLEQKVILGTHTSSACPAPDDEVDCIPSDARSHSIGTVRSAPDGTLWVGSGDAASDATVNDLAFRSYDERSFAGKLMHVDREGRGLPGHPFCPSNTDLDDVCTKLHAKGLRNPFRFTLRPGGGIVLGDVGWGTWEEINLVGPGGKSYGWPCYEGPSRTGGYRDHASCPAEYAKEGTPQAHVGPDHSYAQGANQEAAIVGGPTYTGDAYPAGFRNSIFFGDHAGGFIKRLVTQPSGPPVAEPFATSWFGVDLELSPSGNLAWVDFGSGSMPTGSVREVVYSPGNARPIAVAEATPTSGAAPLRVSFDGSESSDADQDPLVYDWDFGDGSAHSSSATPAHTYGSPGTYTARLTVSDGRGKSDTKTVRIDVGNTPPQPEIQDVPPYRAGQEVDVHGSASDQQDGSPPASAYRWNVTLVHGQHNHFVGEYTGVKDLSFVPTVDHDSDSHYEVTLTVTDSHGLSAADTALLHPQTAPLRLDSEPSGVALSYAGAEVLAPFQHQAGVGFHTTITAPADFVRDGHRYEFAGWSDGGARVHEIDIPAAGLDLEASYRFTNAPPTAVASAAPTSGLSPLQVLFDGEGSSDPENDAISYDWDFGDGSPHSSDPSPSHTYGAAGDYTARLTVTDPYGAGASATVEISAGSAPQVPGQGVTPPSTVPLPTLPATGDRSGPRVRFHPRGGLDARRGLLRGSVFDPAGVRFLQVALGRRRAGACRWWLASKGLLSPRPRPCARPAWLKAKLSRARAGWRWRVSLNRRPLPPGGYRLRFRAGDLLGNKTRLLEGGRRSLLLRVPR